MTGTEQFGHVWRGAMSLPETTLPEPNQLAQINLKPTIHTSQLIARAIQKINLEVTVLEVTCHRVASYTFLSTNLLQIFVRN